MRTNAPHALENYIHALNKGLMKIMSKMGISTLRSYRNAQVFEAVGLSQAVLDRYFTGTTSRVGGIGLEEIAQEALARYADARQAPAAAPLPAGGQYALARGRRAASVDGAEHQHPAASHAHGRLGAVQEVRGDDQRPVGEAEHAARAVHDPSGGAGRCRWRRSSPKRRSCAGS